MLAKVLISSILIGPVWACALKAGTDNQPAMMGFIKSPDA